MCNNRSLVGILAVVLVTSSLATAEESNQKEVRASLERDGWRVAYGAIFTEGDWLEGTAAVVGSIYLKNSAPIDAWIKEEADKNYAKIRGQVANLALEDLTNLCLQSIRQKRLVEIRNLQIEAGFATYNRWQEWSHPSLDTSRLPWRYRNVTERTALPNWHQLYLRYRIVGNTQAERRYPIRRYDSRYLPPYINREINKLCIEEVFYYDYGDNEVDIFCYLRSPDGRTTYKALPKRTATVTERGENLLVIRSAPPQDVPTKLTDTGVYVYRTFPTRPLPPGVDPNRVDWWPAADGRFVGLNFGTVFTTVSAETYVLGNGTSWECRRANDPTVCKFNEVARTGDFLELDCISHNHNNVRIYRDHVRYRQPLDDRHPNELIWRSLPNSVGRWTR
ncbi:MAG: hypothetical protein ABFD89_25910 [Bryobacteraceae bacterium]